MLQREEIIELMHKNGVELDLHHGSASTIKTMYQCPFKQLCKMIKAPKGPTEMAHINFGSATHEFIEKYYKGDNYKNMDADAMRVALSKIVKPLTKKKLEPTIANFFEWERAHNKLEHRHELQMEKGFMLYLDDDLPPIKGFIDLFDPVMGHIVDWKTGTGRDFFEYGKPYPFDYYVQGLTYSIVKKREGYDIKTIEFPFLPTGRSGFVPPTVDDDWLLGVWRTMMWYIRNGVFARNRGPLCPWCEYREHCEE